MVVAELCRLPGEWRRNSEGSGGDGGPEAAEKGPFRGGGHRFSLGVSHRGSDALNLTPADFDNVIDRIAHRVAAVIAQQPRLVDRNDLAKMLNVSVPTIERLQRDGGIPVVRIGRRVLYSPDAVIAALSANQLEEAK